MSALRTKRNQLKKSMMSSCSEISLNLSADADADVDDDDFSKFYEALRTTERTQEKYDTVEVNSCVIEK